MIQNINRNTIIFPLLLLTIGFIVGCGRSDSAEEHTAEKTMDGMAQHAGHSEHSEHSEHGLVPVTSADGEKIRYWTCVMHPSVKMSVEGDCPVCKMDLIPVYEGVGLTLTERQKSLIPVRTESVEFRNLNREIRTVGVLDYNETRMAYASTRISGWIEDLHVDFTGINVREAMNSLRFIARNC